MTNTHTPLSLKEGERHDFYNRRENVLSHCTDRRDVLGTQRYNLSKQQWHFFFPAKNHVFFFGLFTPGD